MAVKRLGDIHSADPALRDRFIREARLLRGARSHRLVAIHDIGETDGQPFLVMELVDGGTLADRLGDAEPVDRDGLIRLIDELEACLTELRQVGIVHRDLKPSNLLIRRGGTPDGTAGGSLLGPDERLVVADFGLARSLDATGLTVGGGTVGYMAPEQQRPGCDVDHRADLFAATALVASAMTGLPPERAVPAVRDRPDPVGKAIGRGTATDPARRHGDAAAWGRELRQALTTQPPSPPTRSPVAWAIAAVAVAVAVLLGVLLGVLWFTDDEAGPGIVGPTEIRAGESVVYTIDQPGPGVYYWTDWQGRTHEEPALRISADGPGRLPITLTEVVDGDARSTTIEVTVVDGGTG